MAARQTSDIFVRLNLENVEGIDKLKSAFRDLDKTLGVSNRTIETARQRISEYVAGTTRSEQVIRGQISALQGLRSQVDLNGRGYTELTAEINQLQTELRGSTDAVERQREALLRSATAGRTNADVLQRQITNLERLRQQTRPGSSAFLQLGQDIDRATASLGRFRTEVSQAASTVTQMPGATFEKVANQVGILQRRIQTLNFTSAEFLQYQQRINLVNLVQSTIVGRQQVRANAALYASPQYRGFVEARAERVALPNTPAGYQQRIGEINAELENITNLERRRTLTLELDQINRRLKGTISDVVSVEQRAVDVVRARVNAQREQLRQSGFGTFSTSLGGRDFKGEQQRETYTQAQQALADLNAAQDAMEAAVRRHQTTLTDIEVGAEQYRQDRLGQLNDAKIAASDATFKRELAQFDAALQQRDKIERRRNLMGAALGLGPQDRSPFYERVVGLSSAALEAQQAFMGRSPSEVYNDIAKSFSQGARTTLLDRNSEQVGQALGQGVEQGLVATTTRTADTFADRWLAAIKARFGIRSPSKVTEQEIGVPLGQGIGLGLVKGLNSVKAQIQSTLRTITAVSGLGTGPLGRAPLPSQGSRFSAQPIPRSQVADEVQAFLVRMAASPTSARRLTRIIGEDIKTSPALSVAMERSMYEKGLGPYRPFIRGAGASPEDIRFDEELFRGRRTRRGLRGDPNFPPMPGYGLEQLLERQATAIAGRTGAFLGPLGAPLRTTATPPASLAPTIAGVIQALDRNRVMPVFRGASVPPPSPTTGAAYSMGSAPFAFPLSGPLAVAGVSGRRAASRSVTESAANYRRSLDAVWESDASAFVKLRDIISSRVQLQAGVLARRLTETRTSLDAAAGETSKAAGLPAATFRRLRAEIKQARETVRRENAVMDASEGRTSLGGFPLEGMLGPSSELGRISAATSMFGAGGGGGGRPPTTPTGPRPGDLSPDIRKLKTELLDFGPVAERSTASLQELRSVLQGQRELAAPGAAGTAMRREFDQVIAASEAMDKRIERELDRRNRSRRRLSGFQMAQIGGAALSGGIFGGPEGLVGGVIGGAFGGVGGAFAGAAAGAQVGMLRQQLGVMTDYAAQLQKLRIALRGITASNKEYQQALAVTTLAGQRFNLMPVEATRSFTRLLASIKGAGGGVKDAEMAFNSVTAAIRATGGGAEQVDGALVALAQVFSKGKVSAEELNQIAERLPGTFTLFAKSVGMTGPELQKALQDGRVGLNDFMKFVIAAGDKYTPIMDKLATSTQNAGERMQVSLANLRVAFGDALIPIGAGIQDTISRLADMALQAARAVRLVKEASGAQVTTERAKDIQRRVGVAYRAVQRQGAQGTFADPRREAFNNINEALKGITPQLGLEGTRQNVAALKDLVEVQRRLTIGNDVAPEVVERRMRLLQAQSREIKKRLDDEEARLERLKQAERQSLTVFEPPKTKDEDAVKTKEKALSETQRLLDEAAQAEGAYNVKIFEDGVALDRKRYELRKQLLDEEQQNELARLQGTARTTAQAVFAYRTRLAEIDRASLEARQAVNLERVRAAAAQGVVTAGGPMQGRYMQGSIGPTSTGPHFDIKQVGGGRFGRADLDRYVQVNGRPLSTGVTVPGGMFDAPRSGRTRHGGYDYAFGAGASLELKGGAKWVSLAPSGGNGDLATFMTPDGKSYAILHGRFVQGPTPAASGAGAAARRDLKQQSRADLSTAAAQAAEKNLALIKENEEREKVTARQTLANALTQSLRDSNYELQNTLTLETERQRLLSSGASQAYIDQQMKLVVLRQAQVQQEETLRRMFPDPADQAARIAEVNAEYEEQRRILQDIYDLNQANANSFGFREGAQRYVESIGTMREATASLTEQGFRGLEDVIFQLTTTGSANFQAFAASILQQTARMIIQQLVLKTIMQAIGAIGGGGADRSFGTLMAGINKYSANGNVFAANGIVPYAMGGIVNRPTLFPFANGGSIGTGLMGEAGPEAIIPLQRGANGKLGVAGGGGTTNVVVNVDASGGTAVSGDAGQAKQLGQAITAAVQAELVKQKRPGGLLAG